ncbi:MAG: hypothetical protein ACEPO8_13690 [Rhodothermaceae bacterium]
MSDLLEKVENIYLDCEEFLVILNEINIGNFDEKFVILKNRTKIIKDKKSILNKSFDVSELKKFNIKFDPLIKQINEKFDSILEDIKIEQQKVFNQLKQEFNKKKLANYR